MSNTTSNEQQAYDLIFELYMLLDDGDRHLLNQYDLTVPRFYLLVHLGEQPGLSPNQLSEIMFCDKSNITRLVQHLATRNLIEKRPHETDGRSFRLFLTPEGEAVREEALATHGVFNHERFAAMQGKMPELLKLMRELRDNLHQTVHA